MLQPLKPTLEFYSAQIDALLNKALNDPDHRLSWLTLGSVDHNDQQAAPDLRTVVLRDFSPERTLLFYTDARSPKTSQFQLNSNACVLLFDHESMMQLRIYGTVIVDPHSTQCLKIRDTLPLNSKHNYNTAKAPGTSLPSASPIHQTDEMHFALLHFYSKTFDLLHLRKEGAVRIQAINGPNGSLKQLQWITP